MRWFRSSLAILAVLKPVLAIIDPTAPATPCVPSRSVSEALQIDIASGCAAEIDITQAVCSDYLAQEILTAISYFCGNQTEAFNYCNGLPGVSVADCQGFDPSGGGFSPDCSQEALDVYNICGNSTGTNLFATGDPVSLVQCLYFDLSLCTPEDGEGHFNTIFTGMSTDCPIPAYTPACDVYSTSSSAPSTTVAPASPSSSSAAPSSPTAAPSFQTSERGPPLSTTATASTPTAAPTAPPNPPHGASPYFHLIINGTFTEFVGDNGGLTTDPAQAQIFYVLSGQLFTLAGLTIQADHGASASEPYPYIPFIGTNGTLPFSATFSLVTAGVDPVMTTKKRQVVGLTTLYWTNTAFTAPATTAEFCVYEYEVFAILNAGGPGADIYALCVPVTLNAVYIQFPQSVSSSSTSGTAVATTATSSLVPSSPTTSATIPTASTLFSAISCPVGQTLFAYTTVYR